MKNNNKFIITLGLSFALLIALVTGVLIIISNNGKGYSFSEKSYMNANESKVIDISVDSNMSAFSENGEGVFYDFISALEDDTKLSFNISVNTSSNYKLTNKNILGTNDEILYEDHYALISSNNNIVRSLKSLQGQAIAVISSDKEYLQNYLSDYNLSLVEYKNFDEIKRAMNDTTLYALVPLQKNISNIVNSRYNVVKHVEGVKNYFVIELDQNESTLSNIIRKFNKAYQKELKESLNEHLLNLFYKVNNITELEKETLMADDLIVGYIENMPYEGKVKNNFSGITNEYLNSFASLTGASYKYIKYKNIEELKKALSKQKVDLIANYSEISDKNYNEIKIGYNTEYEVLSNIANKTTIETLSMLKDKTIKTASRSISKQLEKSSIKIKEYPTYESLMDSLTDDDIIAIERNAYDYYKNKELSNFVTKISSTVGINNSFLIKNDKTTFANLFSYFMSIYGNKDIVNEAINNSIKASKRNLVVEFLINNIFYLALLIGATLIFLLRVKRKVKVTKKIKKEDKLMYLDVMTNLKNRNYLNDNLVYWEANKIYPQTVIVVDLNNISEINDTKGHEEGDNQIIAAAKVLINTQRENSEIIRTDGNEFLIYLVGYEEKAVLIYVNKLMKEFKNLPYNYGASIGYQMITSESMTIDDAINEALKKMRENKEE